MKVFITGIRGFLGASLAKALEARGHIVRGSASTPGDLPCIRLGERVDQAVFGDAETVIHAAHDFQPRTLEANVAGARMLLDAARGRHRILISSHSARADAVSEYGISKYRIERFYQEENETVVRPGLVLGAGGAFARRVAAIRKSRFIPLVDGGRDRIPVLAIDDFCEAMVCVVERKQRGAWNLFNALEPSLREIVDLVLRISAHRAWVVPVSYGLARAVLRAGEGWLPLDPGSLEAMRLNRQRVHQSDLRKLVALETDWAEAIRRALYGR